MTELIIMATPTVLCIVAAGIVAARGKDGWGWFLFASLLLWSLVETYGK